MVTLVKGIIAGLVATVVLSILMVLKKQMGMLPEMDVIKMLAGMAGGTALIGWLMHFIIGSGYGVAYSLLHGTLPGSAIIKGIVLGVIGWLIMMLLLMPVMGAGSFGMHFGMMAPVATLILHVIFGAVLGGTYKVLTGQVQAVS